MLVVAALAALVAASTAPPVRSAHLDDSCFSVDSTTLAQAGTVGAQARASVVVIKTAAGSGTGWFLSSDLVVTNDHVVHGAASITLWLLDGRSVSAHVVASTADPDIALLRVDGAPGVAPLPTGASKGLAVRQPLVGVGNPGGVGNWVVGVGAYGGTEISGEAKETSLVTTVPGFPGSSGSPLLDLHGNVVGMVWGSSTGVSVNPDGSPKPGAQTLRTYIASGTAAVPIEDVLALAQTNDRRIAATDKRPPEHRKPHRPKRPPIPKPPPIPTPTAPEQLQVNCVAPQGGFDASTLTAGQALTDTVRSSVVVIDTGLGIGTGWFLDASGLIVTNNHVVSEAASLTVRLLDGRHFPARVVATEASPDIALIRIDAPAGVVPLQLGSAAGLHAGDPLVAVGHPGNTGYWTATIGRFEDLNGTASGEMETSVPAQPGSSGSPILDLAGRVVGMVWGTTSPLDPVPPPAASAEPLTFLKFGLPTDAVTAEEIATLRLSAGA